MGNSNHALACRLLTSFLSPLIPGAKTFWPTASEQYTNSKKVKMQGLHLNILGHGLDPSYR